MKTLKNYSNVSVEVYKNDSGDIKLYISGAEYSEPVAEYTLKAYCEEEE